MEKQREKYNQSFKEKQSGQTVFHFHMHLIPRYKGDKNDDILKYTPLELSDDEMKEILDMIKVK